MSQNLMLSGRIEERIFLIRGKRVMLDTFGDKPQCQALGSQSRFAEGENEKVRLVALSVNPEDTQDRRFRNQASMLAIGVYEWVDSDLAKLYGVTTKDLLQAVRRNALRFPDDFVYVLTGEETRALRSQIVTSKKKGRGGRRTYPFVFTQEGVAMLSDERFKIVFDAIKKFLQQSSEENKNRMPIGFHPSKERDRI